MSSRISRCLLVTLRRVMIVGNLDTQFPSVGPNPPISLRERGSRAEEKGGIVARDSAVKRGAYSTKLRSRQDNGCPSLAHSHTVSTQLYQTPLSFLLPLCSVLSLSFSHVRLSSPHHRGMGDNENPGSPRLFWGPFLEKRSSNSSSSQWAPSHLLCSTPYTSSTHRFCFGGRMYSSTGSGLFRNRTLNHLILSSSQCPVCDAPLCVFYTVLYKTVS